MTTAVGMKEGENVEQGRTERLKGGSKASRREAELNASHIDDSLFFLDRIFSGVCDVVLYFENT